jgi:hypothetical protein
LLNPGTSASTPPARACEVAGRTLTIVRLMSYCTRSLFPKPCARLR